MDNTKYKNIPPKDIANAIHGGCFDYKNMDKKVLGENIQDRIYYTWNIMHLIMKRWIESDEQDFLNYIKNNEPDVKLD